jgi:hypothetical protein
VQPFWYIVRWQVANEVCAIPATANESATPRALDEILDIPDWRVNQLRFTESPAKLPFFLLSALLTCVWDVIVYPSIRLIFLTAPRWMENEHRVCLNSLHRKKSSGETGADNRIRIIRCALYIIFKFSDRAQKRKLETISRLVWCWCWEIRMSCNKLNIHTIRLPTGVIAIYK